jgi:hypothetical protein
MKPTNPEPTSVANGQEGTVDIAVKWDNLLNYWLSFAVG